MSRRSPDTAGRNGSRLKMNRAVKKHFRDFGRFRRGYPGDLFNSSTYKRRGQPREVVTLLFRIVLVLSVSTFAASAQRVGNSPGSNVSPSVNAERIHFGDVVDVDFVGSLEFDWRGGLTSEGFLDGLDQAEKPVYALCKTEAEAAAEVAAQHKYFLRDPKVIVRIVDRSNRALAYVTGAVRTAQRFQLRRAVSLLELIVLSGGITDRSNGEIVVFRPPNVSCGGGTGRPDTDPEAGKPKRTLIKIADLLAGKPDANVQILIGDAVNVIEAPPVFVTGDVVSGRRMNLTPELTLSRAISSAGGVSRSFSGQKAFIHRRKPEPKVFEFDLRRIIEKKAKDPELEPYDVIEVEQRGFDSRKIVPVHEPPEMNAETMLRLPLRIVD
jgi:protein involved in polysaccharide export with SLBB domain